MATPSAAPLSATTYMRCGHKRYSLRSFAEADKDEVSKVNEQCLKVFETAKATFQKTRGIEITRFNITSLHYKTADGQTDYLVIDPSKEQEVAFLKELKATRTAALGIFSTALNSTKQKTYSQYDAGNLQNNAQSIPPSHWLIENKTDMMTQNKDFLSRLQSSQVITDKATLTEIKTEIVQAKKLRIAYVKKLTEKCDELKASKEPMTMLKSIQIQSIIYKLNELKRNEFTIWWNIVEKKLQKKHDEDKTDKGEWTPDKSLEQLQRFFKITPPKGFTPSVGFYSKRFYKNTVRGKEDPNPVGTEQFLAYVVSATITDQRQRAKFCQKYDIITSASQMAENSITRVFDKSPQSTSPIKPLKELKAVIAANPGTPNAGAIQAKYSELESLVSDKSLVHSLIQLYKTSPQEANDLVLSLLDIMETPPNDIEIPEDDEKTSPQEKTLKDKAKEKLTSASNYASKKWKTFRGNDLEDLEALDNTTQDDLIKAQPIMSEPIPLETAQTETNKWIKIAGIVIDKNNARETTTFEFSTQTFRAYLANKDGFKTKPLTTTYTDNTTKDVKMLKICESAVADYEKLLAPVSPAQ